MKKQIFTLLLLPLLLTGCATTERLDSVRSSAERLMDSAADAVESAAMDPTQTVASRLTKAQAEEIALRHAGFTADQVNWLRAEYEVDNGRPQYEVEFHQGIWEYSFEIDGETGEILSYDRDD